MCEICPRLTVRHQNDTTSMRFSGVFLVKCDQTSCDFEKVNVNWEPDHHPKCAQRQQYDTGTTQVDVSLITLLVTLEVFTLLICFSFYL